MACQFLGTSGNINKNSLNELWAWRPESPPLMVKDPEGLAQVPHMEYVTEAGSEGIELVMWLIARGAMSDLRDESKEPARGAAPNEVHRFHHVPASNTSVGHVILENI